MKSWVRWGGDAKVDLIVGAAGARTAQFIDMKLKRPTVVRIRVAAEQVDGTGNCTGCIVLVRVRAGVGSTELPRLLALGPTNTVPMESFLDTPAESIQCEAELIPGASLPPYGIRITALVAPWFDTDVMLEDCR